MNYCGKCSRWWEALYGPVVYPVSVRADERQAAEDRECPNCRRERLKEQGQGELGL